MFFAFDRYILANKLEMIHLKGRDPDEMQASEAFHLSFHYLPQCTNVKSAGPQIRMCRN